MFRAALGKPFDGSLGKWRVACSACCRAEIVFSSPPQVRPRPSPGSLGTHTPTTTAGTMQSSLMQRVAGTRVQVAKATPRAGEERQRCTLAPFPHHRAARRATDLRFLLLQRGPPWWFGPSAPCGPPAWWLPPTWMAPWQVRRRPGRLQWC